MKPLVQEPEHLERRLKEIPLEPGIYLMRDRADQILYIGKSKKLRSRVRSYFRDHQAHTPRIAMMVQQVVEIEFIVTDTEAEALALEANLVKQHQPYFNVLLKDDKKYPYLCITWSDEYPRIFITRKRQLRHPQDRYYGPYVDSRHLRQTLDIVKRTFPLRQRPKPLFKDRPCLNYDLGRCPGVCQQLISPTDYHKIVQKVAMIFQGRTTELIEHLTQQMYVASEALNFEVAGRLRDQIYGLQSLHTSQKVSLPDDRVSRDVIALARNTERACIQLFQIRAGQLVGRLGFMAEVSGNAEDPQVLGEILQRTLEEHYQQVEGVEIPTEIVVQSQLPDPEILTEWLQSRKGRKIEIIVPQRQTKAELVEMVARNAEYELARLEKASDRNMQALENLAEILELTEIPRHLEGYDISHIQGSDAVASRVVFIDGVPAKQHYRHYKIKNPEIQIGHSDDFASLAEVIRRRFDPQKADPLPDLVMIDGGKGQLSAVVAVLAELKLLDRFTVISLAKQREEIFKPGESEPLPTEPEWPGVQLLRQLRDEAHRFAITFHRNQRSARMKRSRLDEIPGLGHQRQKQLLAHFHSIDYIRLATPEQLAEVPGIGPQLAAQIYAYFQ
mgnify:CR=1 FL=1